MTIALGAGLVLLTWVIAGLSLIVLGFAVALFTSTSRSGARIVRHAMWWGLLIGTTLILLLSLMTPLRSVTAGLIFAAALTIAVVAGAIAGARRRLQWSRRGLSRGLVALVGALLLGAGYLAVSALGPVTNYDSGLYHLGAIRYAADFGTVTGLANLYFPFGYGTSHFPVAAFLSNGPWGEQGFRLLNGFLMVVAMADLILRMRTKRLGPGFYVLATGLLAALVPMIALSDYWVTSPSQDSAVLILTIVAAAYLTDAVRGHRDWRSAALVAVAIGLTIALVRPTAAPYTLVSVAVLLALGWRRRTTGVSMWTLTPLVVIALVAAVSTLLRDRLLSGWIQYPLSLAAFDAPWRAAEPSLVRAATLGYHRNPEALWESITGWAWVQPWLGTRLTQWETYELAALLVVALFLTVLAARRRSTYPLLRSIAITLLPSAAAVGIWWFATPPSYRFIWGPLFTLGAVPIGWSLWYLTRTRPGQVIGARGFAAAAMSVPLVLLVSYSAFARLDTSSMSATGNFTIGITIGYRYAPVPPIESRQFQTQSGLSLRQPIVSDQCWDEYPLCTPEPAPDLRLIGGTIESGFIRSPR